MSVATNKKMTVRAIAPWFGGKRTMAPLIVRELGKHTQYFEPFCGSMAVLMCKEPSQKETVSDLHGDLINLAKVIQNRESAEDLYDRLGRALYSEGLLDEARELLEHDSGNLPAVERAYWFFLASWMGRNGTAGTARVDYQIAVRWTKGGGSPTVRWRNAVDSLPAWHERLRNVVILRRNAFQILDRFEDVPETAIYCDPPYTHDSRAFKANGQGSKYLHEFEHRTSLFGADDHTQLRDLLVAYERARIVVSYYDSPEVRRLYQGWTFVEHTRQKHLHSSNGRGARPKSAPEVLIVNGESYADTRSTGP